MHVKPGFIASPWTSERGDSVSAESVVRWIEKRAHHGCGLHDDIYHQRALDLLLGVMEGLEPFDAETLKQAASRRGFNPDRQDGEERCQRCHETCLTWRRRDET